MNFVCSYFVEEFCIHVHKRYWPAVFFFCNVLVCLWCQSNVGFIKWAWKCSILETSWRKLALILLYIFGRIYQRFFFFFLWRFLITDSVSVVIGLFRFSIFYDSILVGWMFLEMYLLLPSILEKAMATQYSCLKNPMDRGAWWGAIYGVTQSWTWLKRLSSSSSSSI